MTDQAASRGPGYRTKYGYDSASRLSDATNGTYRAHYYYLANSPLVSDIDFFSGTDWKMRASKSYDPLNRLTQATSSSADGSVLSYGFQYNDANQRTRVSMPDGSSWVYQYDELGQVVSGKRYWADGTPVAGQQFEYAFDDIGNRTATKAGGDSSGGNLRSASYSNDLLNLLTEREVPGAVDITGISHAQATNRVNGQAPNRYGEYFHLAITTNNGTGPVWLNVTNTAWLSGVTNSQTGHVYLAKSPEAYGYDEDGNLTSDGRWTYTWDAENRLVQMVSLSSVTNEAKRKMLFAYDYQGRRIQTVVYTNNGAGYVGPVTNKYVYDGWNLVAMLNSDLSFQNSFMWGLDASGTMQGAGGVGGLLAMTIHSGSLTGTYFYCYDGNYNVVGLARGSDGVMLTRYEYGPFGEVIRATGPLSAANPFHFSTKYEDSESGFLYYGFRSYNPSTGRWLSRDPAGESGGVNLYGILDEDPLNYVDILGLDKGATPLPASATKCCTAQMIANGEKTLNANFQMAKAAAKAGGIKPATGDGGGATCKNSSLDIIDWLAPFPPCWRCHLEERNYYSPKNDPNDTRWDHQVVICTAYLPGSVKNKEIIFDWWGDVHYWWKRDVSGGPPTDFRKEYKYPGKITDSPFYTNCDGTLGYKGPSPKPCFSCSLGGAR